MRRTAVLALLAAVALGSSACGDEDGQATDTGSPTAATGSPTQPSPSDSDATDSPSASAEPSVEATPVPACAEVWVDGAKLPRGYDACETDGAIAKPKVHRCSSGQRLVTHAGIFWAVAGATIHETDGLDGDADFKQAKLACLA